MVEAKAPQVPLGRLRSTRRVNGAGFLWIVSPWRPTGLTQINNLIINPSPLRSNAFILKLKYSRRSSD